MDFVQYFTDVDDKIINKANAEGTDWKTISDRYIDAYFQVMDALHVRQADVYPRVSEHMDDIIHMVETLIQRAMLMYWAAMCIMIFPPSRITAGCRAGRLKICWQVPALK